MRTYKIEITYDGSKYKGWQKLGNTDITIQGKIEGVLSKFSGCEIEINGSGRTDAGVHALKQTASFSTEDKIDESKMIKYFYEYLPEDIQVVNIKEVEESFHARYKVVSKIYSYKINNSKFRSVFNRKYEWNIPLKLNYKKMEEASKLFIGSHDFTAFTTAKSKNKSMIRNVLNINMQQNGELIKIDIEADGFLHNMVRKIVGALVEVGLDNLKIKDIERILIENDRAALMNLAPAHGLYLKEVKY